MDFKYIYKRTIPHILAILSFIVVASIYFSPAWEGKTLQGEDVVGGAGKAREKRDFKKYESETVIWNGSIFSGMPEYIHAKYEGASSLKKVFYLPMKMGLPREVASIFWYMLGFYILLSVLGVPPPLAAGGSIAFALGSYNIIIILAGHYMKVYTLALIPPTLAGIILIFKGKYRWGFILASFFLAMQITMAHIQMMYYFLIFLIIYGFIELYHHLKEKQLKIFYKSALVLIAAAIMGVVPNYSMLVNYYKYNDVSMRGSSEVTTGEKSDVKTNKGLDKDYINMWSSGVDEAMMVVFPNVKGGSTATIKQNKELLKSVPSKYRQTLGNFNQYWGNQPFSGGPNYLGIVFSFLFFLGTFVLKGPVKNSILITVILFLLLAMGGNLSFFTDLWIEYFPMYNKFRTPVSILALSAILVSFYALYSIYKISADTELLEKKVKLPGFRKTKPVYLVASGLFVGFILLNIAFPHLFNSYISNGEHGQIAQWQKQANVGNQVDLIINELVNLRIGVFRADLYRALFFTVALTLSLYFFAKKKISKQYLWGIVIVLALVDFWGVSRRYVSLDHFHAKGSLVKKAYALSSTDRKIYQYEMNINPDLKQKYTEYASQFPTQTEEEKDALLTHVINKYTHYRVFNLAGSPFQENVTASAHKSIGGYHPAKLRRYQDMVDHYIGKMNMSVLNMLNTQYFVTSKGLQINPNAMGHAWFVNSIEWVEDANDEILALNDFNLSSTAVVAFKEKDKLAGFSTSSMNTGKIILEDYSPDKMTYSASSDLGGLAVFSEVFYDDWKVFIDGKESDIITANYILRGVVIPKGDHKVEFVFHPSLFYTSNAISQIAFILLLLILGIFISMDVFNKIKNKEMKS